MLAEAPEKTLTRYEGVTVRFLNKDERLVPTAESELPLVIEARDRKDVKFLQEFLDKNSAKLLEDCGKYGALLFRGFDIQTDRDFEHTLLKIKGLQGISDAFMAEHGRDKVGDLKYVLHTNSIYKTGGTLYLGGFHSENYYSPDVPGFISFCCLNPSTLGGETGLINLEHVYEKLDDKLKKKLESHAFFVTKWLVSDVAKRYHVDEATVETICRQYDLPIVGEGEDRLILLYKPSVFINPVTEKKALAINFFALPTLDDALRHHFLKNYQGKPWFWHRFVWRIPRTLFKSIENLSVFLIALWHSPKELFQITSSNWKADKALKKLHEKLPKVNSCFSESEIKQLADLMHDAYSSTLWHKGDILLVDNKKVAHAGMPGSGARLVRALITNPLQMKYSASQSGCLRCQDRTTESIGYYLSQAKKTTRG